MPPFPRPTWDAGSAAESLAALYDWAETHTRSAVGWYLEKKRTKARFSRWLRLAAILLVAAGSGVPVVVTTLDRDPSWLGAGYLLLGAAASCLAVDKFFGISTAWMRYLTTELTLQRELQRFQISWAELSINSGRGLGPDEIGAHLALLARFTDRVAEEMAAETNAWVDEFRGTLTELQSHATARGNAS